MYIGPKYGHEMFSLMNRYDGSKYLPRYGNKCQDTILNSTEGVMYAQYLTRQSVLKYWRKTSCKVFSLHYNSNITKYGINGYKYVLPPNAFDRTGENDCHASDPPLLNGLTDASKCFYGTN